MDLLSTVATALLMGLQAEESQQNATSHASYPHPMPYPQRQRKVAVGKENVSPAQSERGVSNTPEGKRPFAPAAAGTLPKTNMTPSSQSGSEISHVIEYYDSSPEEEDDTDLSTKKPSFAVNHGPTVHLDLSQDGALDHHPNNIPYWMQPDWFPTVQVRNAHGLIVTEQKSPDAIRRELQQFIRRSTKTKTALLQDLGVNSNSFRKFMDAPNYKDPWRAGTSTAMIVFRAHYYKQRLI